jgi:hypothetical protein
MKTFVMMLALAMGLTFGAATFATADEKAGSAPAAPAATDKKDGDKKDAKAEKKGGKKDAKK